MSNIKSKVKGTVAVPFMADFLPMNTLWNGSNAPYPSEHSARWALRKLRDELAMARAVAVHRGSIMVHPQRFAEVAEKAAINEFSSRHAKTRGI